jgi:hypothetical protein
MSSARCQKCNIEITKNGPNVGFEGGVPNWVKTCKDSEALKKGVPLTCKFAQEILVNVLGQG